MSTIPSVALPRAPSAARRNGPSGWLIAGLLVFGALPLSFGILRLLQLAGVSDVMPPAQAPALPLVLHICGALLYTILGAFQFSAAIRRRWPAWHRAAGRVALVGASLIVVSALWLTASYATVSAGGIILAAFRLAVVATMAVAIGIGLAAAIVRDIPRHRAWMIRAYALGLGAATQMLVLMVAEMVSGGAPSELNRALLMGLAWGINLVVAEWAIRHGRQGRIQRP